MGDLRELRLLIVDEELEYFQLFRECVELCHHQFPIICTHASSEEEARKLLGTWRPTAVMVDVHNTKADAFKFMEDCKGSVERVIAASENMSLDVENTAMNHGANDYFCKSSDPEDIERLLARIDSLRHPAPDGPFFQ